MAYSIALPLEEGVKFCGAQHLIEIHAAAIHITYLVLRLLDEIGSEATNKILIFVETKRKADDLTRLMRRDGYPAMCIHGDKQQKERDWVLGEFKQWSTTILVATDVAAR